MAIPAILRASRPLSKPAENLYNHPELEGVSGLYFDMKDTGAVSGVVSPPLSIFCESIEEEHAA